MAASLVLLHEARYGRPAPALAWCMLWLGVSATLAANALYGLAWGVLGVALSAWPGAAFVGSVELLMGMVRRTRETGQALPALTQVAHELRKPRRLHCGPPSRRATLCRAVSLRTVLG